MALSPAGSTGRISSHAAVRRHQAIRDAGLLPQHRLMTNPFTTVVPLQTARTGLRMLLVDSGGIHALRAAP